jgi:hypothetical protein
MSVLLNNTLSDTRFRVISGDSSAVSFSVSDTAVYIGNPTADSTGALLVLDTKNSTGDPSNVNGAMYYNSNYGRFRCHENGVWKNCISAGPTVVRFTSSGTFSKATYPWATRVKVMVQGAGGAGGGATTTGGSQSSCGGGGAGGGYAESWLDVSSLASSETVTVGTGGASSSGAAGGNGTNTSFGSLVSATGGLGGAIMGASGTLASINGGGSSSQTVVGDLASKGGAGEWGTRISATSCIAGHGGDSQLGKSERVAATGVGADGADGQPYGAGGTGGRNGQNAGAARPGGDGADGIVIVEIY